MRPFEYLILLAAIVLGLALTDLALSTQRLLNSGARVKWDWFAPLAALLAFLKIVTQWWNWYGTELIAQHLTFDMFVVVLLSAGLHFLLAATALPDEIGEQGIDLRAYYETVQRRYWLLFSLSFFVTNVSAAWIQVHVGGASVSLSSPLLLVLPAALILSVVRHRWLQGAGLLGFVALYLWQETGRLLTV